MFRNLNQEELSIIAALKKRGKLKKSFNPNNWEVSYTRNGNFTIAVTTNSTEHQVGVAKFNPSDRNFYPEVGERIAFRRAIVSDGSTH